MNVLLLIAGFCVLCLSGCVATLFIVDEKELPYHIRARQAAGQKGRTSPNKGRKYRWFIVCETVSSEACPEYSYSSPHIVRGLTPQTVERRYTEHDFKLTMRADYGGVYAPVYHHQVIAAFNSKEEAKKYLPNWRDFINRKDNHDAVHESKEN